MGLENKVSKCEEATTRIDVRLGVRLSIRVLLALNLPANNVFPDIVLLAQVEELPDLGCPLGTETLGKDVIGESWDFTLTLLDDNEGEDGNIGANDAATDGLAPAFTGAADAIAGVAVGEQEADTVGEENTLLHRETLLVVSTSDTEDVAFPFVTERVAGNFLGDLLVVEDAARKFNNSDDIFLELEGTYNRLSSSTSMSFWAPVAGSTLQVNIEFKDMVLLLTSNVELHSETIYQGIVSFGSATDSVP